MTTPEAVAGADLGGYSGATGGDRAPAGPGVEQPVGRHLQSHPGSAVDGHAQQRAGIRLPGAGQGGRRLRRRQQGGDPAIALVDRIPYAAASPSFTSRGDMPVAAMNVLATSCPTGRSSSRAAWSSALRFTPLGRLLRPGARHVDTCGHARGPAQLPLGHGDGHRGTSLVFGGNPPGSHENR